MKILKIENGNGLFLKSNEYQSIESIGKEDILILMEKCMNETVEIDESANSGDKKINSPAQKIIYDSIAKNFSDLVNSKDKILSQIESDFSDAKRKYMSL